jgi:DNA ligase-1
VVPALLAGWLDALDSTGRWALLKLITGGLRVGVSARLARTAVAAYGNVAATEVEELWHGLTPPFADLFAWLDGRAARPEPSDALVFRPLMLANPLAHGEIERLEISAYAAEWKWDGIRVQCAAEGGRARLFSRNGDDISGAFPDLLDGVAFDAVVDGELLVLRAGEVAPFNDLQQRLNRKTVTAKMMAMSPAHLRLYDLLIEDGVDLRSRPFIERRDRLESWFDRMRPSCCDLSPLIPFRSIDDLHDLRAASRARGLEGLMLKRRDSSYVAGRPKGPWFKWKRDPLTLDVVLMYAQRGHGKRSSFYSDYTFGAWRDDADGRPELVPVGKAYSGYTDDDLHRLDKWVRDHTVERYGPVREVSPGLVLEVAFDAVQRSTRHRSGVAMRFPRIHRIRWDKPPDEAERPEALTSLID